MSIMLLTPGQIDAVLMEKILRLIELGDQIPDMAAIPSRIERADHIALQVENEELVAVAVLKNPNPGYAETVFGHAESVLDSKPYNKELGYIVTHPNHTGKGYCQKLITTLYPFIKKQKVFSTTRNPRMAKILEKFGFVKEGKPYNNGLNLYIKTPLIQ